MLACYAAQPSCTAIPSCINDTFDMAFHTAFHQPVSFAAAMRSPQVTQWMAAMDEEKQAFFDNVTWEVVDLNPTWNLLSSKWVFKIKRDEHGHISRYRARLVARVFLQREGVDYGDIFSPVVRYSTLKMLLALSAHYDLYKRHLDCPKAFTQADSDTPCYMKPPPGMKLPCGKCLRLHKSIYGLKQASRLFNQLLVSFFHQLGFTVCPNDTCLMYLVTTDELILVASYVDDILLCATSLALADDITTQFEAKFNCVNLGEISWCLGMRIRTSDCRHIVTLDLDQYIQTILAPYQFDQHPAVPTPMLHDLKLSAADCPSTDAETKVMELPFSFSGIFSHVCNGSHLSLSPGLLPTQALACLSPHIPVPQGHQHHATDIFTCRRHSCSTVICLFRCRLGHHRHR